MLLSRTKITLQQTTALWVSSMTRPVFIEAAACCVSQTATLQPKDEIKPSLRFYTTLSPLQIKLSLSVLLVY